MEAGRLLFQHLRLLSLRGGGRAEPFRLQSVAPGGADRGERHLRAPRCGRRLGGCGGAKEGARLRLWQVDEVECFNVAWRNPKVNRFVAPALVDEWRRGPVRAAGRTKREDLRPRRHSKSSGAT